MKRKKIKTILCHMAIITICAGVFCHGYINGISISKYDRIHSYAEADNWISCDTSDLVTAFRYYCKSRNLALEGSIADAVTSFTTQTFNNICSKLGIDPTSLQAELKKTTMGNLGLRFLFSQTGITAYNRIFAEFLQNNDLSVGDSVNDDVIYSSKYFADADGNKCFVYIISNYGSWLSTNNIYQMGTTYKYDGYSYMSNFYPNGTATPNGSLTTTNWHLTDSINYSYTAGYFRSQYVGDDNNCRGIGDNDAIRDNTLISINNTNEQLTRLGNFCIFSTTSNGQFNGAYSFGLVCNRKSDNKYYFTSLKYLGNLQFDDADIYLTTNNNTINNNTYNNNYTIIYQGGDTYITDDDDEPLPNTPPGGGGGDDPGGDPDNWNPTTPTIPGPSSPDFPTIELPDIDIPDFPSLNFSLGDLRNKFPFSLPFDIIAILNVLDGEPQAPHIEATVPIGRWYTWEMDFDFAEFDNYARIFRAFEFIGFCIGLAIFTVHFVKG